ncbi:MAG: hypothetical protein AUK58_00880 [Candidatus Moranbacteria bacterium CG2_30_41_165]|nr:MAG: hypothetical protein AUK58_00880 [Candidatus Moranbacteria bacterium CG2_30_41_165]
MSLKNGSFLIILLISIIVISFFFFTQKSHAPLERKNVPTEDISFDIPVLDPQTFPDRNCRITDYGALSDGKASNTEAIKKAITDCAKNGGGKVIIPAGTWLTGPIVLQSHINLLLEKDAEILFSTNPDEYLPVVLSRFEGMEFYNYSPLIYALDAENIAITGEGVINGNGEAWYPWKTKQGTAVLKLYDFTRTNAPVKQRIFGTPSDALRPSFIQFVRSKNILLEGVTFIHSPMWSIHPLYSENILMRNIKVDSDGPNTDGIVIDSSKNVIIENVYVNSGDDAIVIKSGKDADGLRVGKPSENIVVRNSTIKNGHSGFAIGSEMSGSVRNVLFEDTSIDRTDFGLQIKSMRGRGGVVENIWMRNIQIRRASNQAILVDMQYGTPIDPLSSLLPAFHTLHFQNIECRRTDEAIIIRGLENSPIQNIKFSNITIGAKSEGQREYAENMAFENVVINILPKEQKK